MKLYIKVIDGQPDKAPFFEENLLEFYKEGIPPEYEPFERLQNTLVPSFTQKVTLSFQKNENGVWHDVWTIVELTEQELAEKNTRLTEQAYNELATRKRFCMQHIEYCMTNAELTGVMAWEDCLARHNSWELKSINPFVPNFPPFPVKRPMSDTWDTLPAMFNSNLLPTG